MSDLQPIEDHHHSSRGVYWCFISYRHADNKEEGRQWATWLHQAIETYEVPEDLVGTRNERGDSIPERIFPVFRDEEELPADADLSIPIYRALDRSRFLVALCSPRAVASTYVDAEIRYFKQRGKADRVLAALIEGEPNASWDKGKHATGIDARQECFPRALQHPVNTEGELILSERAEPIAADFRLGESGDQGWTTPEALRRALVADGKLSAKSIDDRVARYRHQCELAKLKIIAGILGIALGQLTRRDAAYQLEMSRKRSRVLRRWLSAVAMLALLALAAATLAQWQAARARRAEDHAARKAVEATNQAHRASRNMAETAINLADNYAANGNADLALAQLSAALCADPGNSGATTRAMHLIESRGWPVPLTAPINWTKFQANGMLSPTADGRAFLLINGLKASVIRLSANGWSSSATISLPNDSLRNALNTGIINQGSPAAVEFVGSESLVTVRRRDGAIWLATGVVSEAGEVVWKEAKISSLPKDHEVRLICTRDRSVAVVVANALGAESHQTAWGFKLPSGRLLGVVQDKPFPRSSLYSSGEEADLISFEQTPSGIRAIRVDFAREALEATDVWTRVESNSPMLGNFEFLDYHAGRQMLAGTSKHGVFVLHVEQQKPTLEFWEWQKLPGIAGVVTGGCFSTTSNTLYLLETTRVPNFFHGFSSSAPDHRPGAALANSRVWAFAPSDNSMRCEPIRLQNSKLEAMDNREDRGLFAIFGRPTDDEVTIGCNTDVQRFHLLPALSPTRLAAEALAARLQELPQPGSEAPPGHRNLVFAGPDGKSLVLMQSASGYCRLGAFDFPSGKPRWAWSYLEPTTTRFVRFQGSRYFRIRLGIENKERDSERILVFDQLTGRPIVDTDIDANSFINDVVDGDRYFLLTRDARDEKPGGVDYFNLTEGLPKSEREIYGSFLGVVLTAFSLNDGKTVFSSAFKSYKYPDLIALPGTPHCLVTTLELDANKQPATRLNLVVQESGRVARTVVTDGERLTPGVWNEPRRELWFGSSKRTLAAFDLDLSKHPIHYESGRIESLACSDDGTHLAYAVGRNAYVLRLDDLEQAGTALLHDGPLAQLQFLDQRFLLTRTRYKNYFNKSCFWDLRANQQWREPVSYGSTGDVLFASETGLVIHKDLDCIFAESPALQSHTTDSAVLAETAAGLAQFTVERENSLRVQATTLDLIKSKIAVEASAPRVTPIQSRLRKRL